MGVIKNQLFIAAALFVGVAIGYFAKGNSSPTDDDAVPRKERVEPSQIPDRGADGQIAGLRRRIAELERALAQKNAESPVTNVVAQVPSENGARRPGPPSMKDMRERMEKLAKEDPQRFAQMTNRMARFRQHRIDRANAKLDFLEAIDTSVMSDEQKKAHAAYQELLFRREELEDKMHDPNLSDEERESAMQQMREADRKLHQSANQERELLIGQTVRALGFSGDDAETVGTTIREVIGATEVRHAPPPPPSGGGAPR